MPRFVLLYHECPPSFGRPSHWDLMLEREGALMTWSLSELPKAWQSSPAADDAVDAVELNAERIADHRVAYLDYEGPISSNRGQVTCHDSGDYEVRNESSPALVVELRGDRVRGVVELPGTPTGG